MSLIRLAFYDPVVLVPGIVIIACLIATYLLLLYRFGLLAAIVAGCVTTTLITLPITSDLSAPTTMNSILVVCGIVGLALFGLRSTTAGQPIFRLDL